MQKLQNLLADLKKLNSGQETVRIDWVIAKLEPIITDGLRETAGKDAHIRGVENKNVKLEREIEHMKFQVAKVRAVVPFCPRCDQPYCGMACYAGPSVPRDVTP